MLFLNIPGVVLTWHAVSTFDVVMQRIPALDKCRLWNDLYIYMFYAMTNFSYTALYSNINWMIKEKSLLKLN